MAGLAWIFPGTSSLLHFTEAETDFLFPAPVSRRQLLIHRMIRSQFGLLFAAMVPAFLFTTPGTTSIAGDVASGHRPVDHVRDGPASILPA